MKDYPNLLIIEMKPYIIRFHIFSNFLWFTVYSTYLKLEIYKRCYDLTTKELFINGVTK